jgi:hypothetical protein
MRKCFACNKQQEDTYFTRDKVACDDCTPTSEELLIRNKTIAEIVFGLKR